MPFPNPSTGIDPSPRQYTLPPGSGLVDIPATKFARRVYIQEDGNVSAFAGFSFKYANGRTIGVTPDQQPLVLGDSVQNRNSGGNFLAMPAQDGLNARVADIYGQASSVNGTIINVWEEE